MFDLSFDEKMDENCLNFGNPVSAAAAAQNITNDTS